MYSKFGQFIDGKWQPSSNKETYNVINPATEEIIGKASKASESLETGMVAVNTPFLSSAETPFGGIKQSGYGREGGSVGINDYLNLKYTHLGISQ